MGTLKFFLLLLSRSSRTCSADCKHVTLLLTMLYIPVDPGFEHVNDRHE